MTAARIMDLFSAWLDTVAACLSTLLARLRQRPTLLLRERERGVFVLALPEGGTLALRLGDPHGPDLPPALAARLKDQPVELALDGGRMLLRPLELPRAAAPYLDGIVRAQIDRLTPWPANEVLYGWTAPEDTADERIRLMVAATPRAPITPMMARLRGLGAGPVCVVAALEPSAGGATVRLLDQAAGQAAAGARLRSALVGVLAGAALLATAALVVSDFAARSLDEELEGIQQTIAATRRQLMAARDGQGAGGSALRALEQRKREVPAAVLVLEDLSRVLPDDTYVTDLQLDAGQVPSGQLRIAGISAAPADLIRLMEQSGRFTQATFVAPTTPQPDGHGARFDIEARLAPPAEAGR
ncbi:PilN domain-containing protein [Xanthobacter sediminis]